MGFSEPSESEDATVEEAWLALSDPVLIEQSVPGGQLLVPADGEDENVEADPSGAEPADRAVEWETGADVFGRIARVSRWIVEPVADRLFGGADSEDTDT